MSLEIVNKLEADMNSMETEQAKIADGKLKYFDVTIEYGGTEEKRILAVDKYDAEDKAREEASYDNADLEIDSVTTREVKR